MVTLVTMCGRYALKAPDDELSGLHGALVVVAGLYELWRDPAKDIDDATRWLWTATVLTTTVI